MKAKLNRGELIKLRRFCIAKLANRESDETTCKMDYSSNKVLICIIYKELKTFKKKPNK
jgi:hypothetical protein